VRRLITSAAAIVLGLALLGTGCGGDDGDGDAAAEAPPVDAAAPSGEGGPGDAPGACTLLTDEEISEQLTASEQQGGSYTYELTKQESEVGEGSVCSYEWATEEQAGEVPVSIGSFTVDVVPTANFEITRGEFDEEPIADVGDEAFFVSETPHAIVGDWVVKIVNLQRTEDAGVALLDAAAGRLP